MREYEIFCSARRARRSRRQVLQIFTPQTLVDSTNSYQESLAMEHVDHRIVQLQKIYLDYFSSIDLDMYLSSYLFSYISSCWTLVHVRGLWPLQKSGTDGHTDSQTRTAF